MDILNYCDLAFRRIVTDFSLDRNERATMARVRNQESIMYKPAQHVVSSTSQKHRRPPSPPPDYDDEEGDSLPGTQDMRRSYMFFPFSDAERASVLIRANRWRLNQGKSPYTVVAASTDFRKQAQAVAKEENISALQLHSLIPTVTNLSRLSTSDKVYIDGHGEPGAEYFMHSDAGRINAQEVASILVKRFQLPENVEVRITACWGASTTEIHFPQTAQQSVETPGRMQDIFAYIRERHGNFSDTLAGSLERHLMLLQPTRRLGSVSGYIGKVTTNANSNEKIRATAHGQGELVKEHAQAAFPVRGTSAFLSIRRSDVRRSALGLLSVHGTRR